MAIKAISLFSGVGGFDLAFEREGFELAGMCEFSPQKQAVLQERFPSVPLHDDIKTLYGTHFGPAEVVTFGSPCTDLSKAGLRAGLDAERSGLFFEAIRFIREMQEATHGQYPHYAVWENVPGAFSSNRGEDFAAILGALADLGALDIAYGVFDSRDYGVPQRRKRILLVADFRGERAAEVLAVSESLRGHFAPSAAQGQDLPGSARASIEDAECLDHRGQGGVSGTLQAKQQGYSLNYTNPVVYRHLNMAQHVDSDGSTSTLLARDWRGGPNDIVAGNLEEETVLRRLTPLECERLQAFPDNWGAVVYQGKVMADSTRYAMMGDAVTVTVAQAIGRGIMQTYS